MKARSSKTNKQRIAGIKEYVDLVPFIRSCGIDLKRSGQGYKGHCPFHKDSKTPSLSVTPAKKLWQCFGCGKGGDIIDFARELDGTDFSATLDRLETYLPGGTLTSQDEPVKKKKDRDEIILSPGHYKLLKRVVDFYHTSFNEDPRAMQYLVDRGITDRSLFADYKIGFANGTLLNVLAGEGKTIRQLKELGILNPRGKEHFYGCATFPLLDANNNPVGIYGRMIHEFETGETRHLYMPGKRRGIFNRRGGVADNSVILSEAILDNLSLINAGFKNSIPCYGTNGLTREIIEHLKTHKIATAYICFDADKAGALGSAKAAAQLAEEKIKTCLVNLPDGYDLNNFLLPGIQKPDDAHSFADLLLIAEGKEPAPKTELAKYQATETGFSLAIQKRCYEVMGIARKDNKLKATVKGITESRKRTKRFHVDTVDFYSARSRAFLCRGLADLFAIDEKKISCDLEQLLEFCENYKPSEPGKQTEEKISATDKAAALAFLKEPNLLNKIILDLETIGFTGEEMNKLLCYLAAVSRKMSDPLSVMIQSRSAAGKSCLQDTILSLDPPGGFYQIHKAHRPGSLL